MTAKIEALMEQLRMSRRGHVLGPSVTSIPHPGSAYDQMAFPNLPQSSNFRGTTTPLIEI